MKIRKILVTLLLLQSLHAADLVVFRTLDTELAKSITPEILPMNRHTSAKFAKNLRYAFGSGSNFAGFYPYSIELGKTLYPQNATGALAEIFFPNPYVFSPNATPDDIARLEPTTLGLLLRRIANASSTNSEIIADFAKVLRVDVNPSEAAVKDFQRNNFYERIRALYQRVYESYFDENDPDSAELLVIPVGQRITELVKKMAKLPEDATGLLESYFFDAKPEAAGDKETPRIGKNQYILYLMDETLKGADSRNTLLSIINTFAWQRFKEPKDIAEFYGAISGRADLDFSEIAASSMLEMSATLSAKESANDILKEVLALPTSTRKGLIRLTESWAAPPFVSSKHRSVTYKDQKGKKTVSDCVEAQVRAFLNGITHRVTDVGIVFDAAQLPSSAPARAFYTGPFSRYETATSQEAHDEFALFVAKKPGVKYASPTLVLPEKRYVGMLPGAGNLAKVLYYVTGMEDPALAEKVKTEAGIKATFTALAGYLSRADLTLSFACDLYHDASIEDFAGEIIGSVNGAKSFVFKMNPGHGELRSLQKPKPTWIAKLPTSGDAFEALPADLKHCVYSTMPLEQFGTLDPALQRSVIVSSSLDDLSDLTKWAVHCFSSANHLLRSLALPMAQRLQNADDYHSVKYFISKLFAKLQVSPDCLTKEEYIALASGNYFLDVALEIPGPDGSISCSSMAIYGYRRGWLPDVASNVKSLYLNGAAQTLLGDPFTADDFIIIVGACRDISYLSITGVDDLPRYADVISNLPKLHRLQISAPCGVAISVDTLNASMDALTAAIKPLPSVHYLNANFSSLKDSKAIEIVGQCFRTFPNLKLLMGLNLTDEAELRKVLPALKGMGLSSKVQLSVPWNDGEDYQSNRARVADIYREVVGHELPEDH